MLCCVDLIRACITRTRMRFLCLVIMGSNINYSSCNVTYLNTTKKEIKHKKRTLEKS